jgi:hypothetical protein
MPPIGYKNISECTSDGHQCRYGAEGQTPLQAMPSYQHVGEGRRGAPVVSAFGMQGTDGRKRVMRQEGPSQDAAIAALDILGAAVGSGAASAGSGGEEKRLFHLFGCFDGHRSDHAAVHCAEHMPSFIAQALEGAGVLQPLPHQVPQAEGGAAGAC